MHEPDFREREVTSNTTEYSVLVLVSYNTHAVRSRVWQYTP